MGKTSDGAPLESLQGLVLPTRDVVPDLWRRPEGHRGHVPQDRNPRPMNGGPGGRGWLTTERTMVRPVARSQGGGGGGFLTENGIYVPLQYTSSQDPLEGGYGFCDWTDGGQTPHPGVDLNSGPSCNSDDGAQIVAPTDGVCVAVLPWDGVTPGEGSHFWLYLDDPRCWAPCWAHFDHLGSFFVGEGQRFTAGQLVATCSRTGGWDCAHSHEEYLKQPPSSWWQWPYGWSVGAVQGAYFDPGVWFRNTVQKAGAMGPGGGVPVDVSEEELAAMAPYFGMYGVQPNMGTAIMKRAGLAYKRDESPGPCLTDEYPYGSYVRQNFTGRIGEYHPDDGNVYWVEVVKDGVSV
jgi:hypothetical protein